MITGLSIFVSRVSNIIADEKKTIISGIERFFLLTSFSEYLLKL